MNESKLRQIIKEHVDSQGRNFDYGKQKSDAREGKMMKKSLSLLETRFCWTRTRLSL